MIACATEGTIVESHPVGNLFLPIPNTDFRDFLAEVEQLPRFAPQILREIEKDLDANARANKQLRLADRRFYESWTADLPDLHVEEVELLADELEIGVGRPRMPSAMVYLFVMVSSDFWEAH